MKKHILSALLALALTANLALLSGCVHESPVESSTPTESVVVTVPGPSNQTTAPTGTTVPPATTVPPETAAPPETTAPPSTTAPPETTAPPQTTPPPETTAPPETTVPQENYDEMIGNLYTRGELMVMENVNKSYGSGIAKNGIRPSIPDGNQTVYGKYGANFIAPDNGNIYLTFDCGYEHTIKEDGKDIRVTEKILDILKEKNVKAVFFVTMYYCKQSPDLIRRMIAEGHTVGNHSNNHPVMPTLSIDKMVYEVMSLHEYVEENFGYSMTLFRPPTGAFSTRSLAVLQSLGYKTVHWSVAYVDWDTNDQPSTADAFSTVMGRAHSGAIYLLHAISATNAAILSDTIDGLRASGYSLELFQ